MDGPSITVTEELTAWALYCLYIIITLRTYYYVLDGTWCSGDLGMG